MEMRKWKMWTTFNFAASNFADAEDIILLAETEEEAIKKAEEEMINKWKNLRGFATVWTICEID